MQGPTSLTPPHRDVGRGGPMGKRCCKPPRDAELFRRRWTASETPSFLAPRLRCIATPGRDASQCVSALFWCLRLAGQPRDEQQRGGGRETPAAGRATVRAARPYRCNRWQPGAGNGACATQQTTPAAAPRDTRPCTRTRNSSDEKAARHPSAAAAAKKAPAPSRALLRTASMPSHAPPSVMTP